MESICVEDVRERSALQDIIDYSVKKHDNERFIDLFNKVASQTDKPAEIQLTDSELSTLQDSARLFEQEFSQQEIDDLHKSIIDSVNQITEHD